MINTLTEGITVSVITDSKLTKNGMKNAHSRTLARLTKKFRNEAYLEAAYLIREHGSWKTLKEASIHIVSFYPRTPMDYDGLACAVAPTIDGMVLAGVLEDDSPKCVKEYHMAHVKVDTLAERRSEITIKPYFQQWKIV
tara:strand:- start:10 stop:426 length:417 start_codon:yes stop_codon:yes gene_type:complete